MIRNSQESSCQETPSRDLSAFVDIALEARKGSSPGTAFWDHEKYIKQPMSANAWMKSCLSIMQHIIDDKDNSLKLIARDGAWTFSIYTQWMLASFQSYFDYNKSKLILIGNGDQRKHISCWRSQPDLGLQMKRFLKQFYSVCGSTDDISYSSRH